MTSKNATEHTEHGVAFLRITSPALTTQPIPSPPPLQEGGSDATKQLIDSRQVRATAALSTAALVTTATSLATDTIAVAVVVLVVQVLAFLAGWRAPSRHPYREVARRLSPLFPQGEAEHPLPMRFAAFVGLLCTAPALLAVLAGWTKLALLLALVCAAAAGLNAFGGICLACQLYPRLQRFKGLRKAVTTP